MTTATSPIIIHELKTLAPFFEEVWAGRKPWELRNNDRWFKVGDWLRLREWDNVQHQYSGRDLFAQINYVLTAESIKMYLPPFERSAAPGLAAGYAILSIKVLRLFELGDGIEHWAAFDGESALQAAMEQSGCNRIDFIEDDECAPWFLNQDMMDKKRFKTDCDNPGLRTIPFREQLGNSISEPGEFPKFFATTEY